MNKQKSGSSEAALSFGSVTGFVSQSSASWT
jgi:hypothetical protein